MTRHLLLTALAMTVGGLPGVAHAADPMETDIREVAAYAIDSDTNQLVRYSFATNDFTVVGVVKTASGSVVTDCESLGFVPSGDAKGFYTVSTKGTFERHVAKIDPLTAVAEVFLPTVTPSNRKITGMVAVYDTDWYILAASSENKTSNKTAMETRELIRIDPSSGTSSIVATKNMLGDGLRFEDLGMDSRGFLYGVSRTRLFRIHNEAGYWVEDLGSTGLDKSEAFTIAFGDFQSSITIPGVNPSWTQNGVFIVADEQIQKFGMLNPANGAFVEYLVNGSPSSFVTKDAEGLVVVTLRRDPLYGSIVGFD